MGYLYSDHMTMQDSMKAIDETHLGQAHIAGTGPEGKTCRECIKWSKRGDFMAGNHGYSGDGNGYMALDRHKCNHSIANKADSCIPHSALACIFFEENPSPPVEKRKKKRLSEVEKARLAADG